MWYDKQTNEIIEKGKETLNKLETQGNKLKKIDTSLVDINNNIESSNNLVKTMESIILNIRNNISYLFSKNERQVSQNEVTDEIIPDSIKRKDKKELEIYCQDDKTNNNRFKNQILLIKEINLNISDELDKHNQILNNLESTTDKSNLTINDLNSRIKRLI